jgi:hypothetical protein
MKHSDVSEVDSMAQEGVESLVHVKKKLCMDNLEIKKTLGFGLV